MTNPTTAAPPERLRLYQSEHTIQVVGNAYTGGEFCKVDGIRLLPVKGGRRRHDPDEIVRLMDATYGSAWPSMERMSDFTDHGQHGEPCWRAGHVDGCPGMAGGDHELREGWIVLDGGDGPAVEIEVV